MKVLPEAVSEDTRISVAVFRIGAPSLPLLREDADFLSRVFDFGPDGLQFKIPATMVVSYTDAEAADRDENNLRPLVFNGSTGEWDRLQVLTRDVDNNTITFEVAGFSLFALGVLPPTAACAADVDQNGIVDGEDLRLIAAALGAFEPDLTGEGVVDVLDLAIMGRFFGEVCA